jgi:hypothetical protein
MATYTNTVNLNDQIWVFFEGSLEEIQALQRDILERFSPSEISFGIIKSENYICEGCQIGFCFNDPNNAMIIKLSY